jgi:nucleoside-diphosphate-sugar epimerase
MRTEPADGDAIGDRTVLILGATGPVGAVVARRLMAEGAHVVAQGRNLGGLARLQAFGASTVQGDLRQARTRTDLLRVGSDAVAVVSLLPPALALPVGEIMRSLPGTCRIHLSSTRVYARPRDQYGLTERDVRSDGLAPCPYVQAERSLMRATQGCVTILRPGRLIGPDLPCKELVNWASAGPLPLVREGNVESSVLRVEELAEAITHLVRTPATGRAYGIYNLTSPHPMGVGDLVDALCAGSGVAVRWRRSGRTGLRIGVAVRDLVGKMPGLGPRPEEVALLLGWSLTLDSSAFRRETGWAPGGVSRRRGP